MEKEQIVKALKACANYQSFGDCDKCPAREWCDAENNFLEREALSLILEQEKRIEEVKAETVRKMQEKFTMHFGTYTPKDEVKISEVFKLLSKFAKELLENNDG